jgi:hypothetical protein
MMNETVSTYIHRSLLIDLYLYTCVILHIRTVNTDIFTVIIVKHIIPLDLIESEIDIEILNQNSYFFM